MNPGRFFIPNMGNMGMQVTPMMGLNSMNPRGLGLFSRISNSIKSLNLGGIINGANKTLNVVNQTIPLIKQAKPMVNNMRSVFKLARAFGNETYSRSLRSNNRINNNLNNNITNNKKENYQSHNINSESIKEINNDELNTTNNDNYPNFFI